MSHTNLVRSAEDQRTIDVESIILTESSTQPDNDHSNVEGIDTTLGTILKEAVQVGSKVATVSAKLMKVGSEYQVMSEIQEQRDEDAKEFTDALKDEEAFAKKAGIVVDKLPKCWTQAKSNIKKAIVMGLDLSSFATESAMRKALNDARKGEGESEVVTAMKLASKSAREVSEAHQLEVLDLITQFNAAINSLHLHDKLEAAQSAVLEAELALEFDN